MSKPLYIFLLVFACILFFSALMVNVDSSHNEIIDKMKLLLFQLAAILVVAKLGGELFSKVFHQPAVLGELLSGVIIGPFALGAIPIPILGTPLFPLPPGALEGKAFPISPELYGIATLASVILLFLSGLETDFNKFLKQSIAGSLVGLGGVLGSFVLADLLTIWFGYAKSFMDPLALFMGTISVATSVGITARVLSEQKALDTPEGTTILAGAVIDDVLGILILAIVVGMVGVKHDTHSKAAPQAQHATVSHTTPAAETPSKPQETTAHTGTVDWKQIGLIGYKAFGFWIGATLIGILLASRIQWFLKVFGNQGTMMALAFGLSLFISGLAEMVGLAAIIGAYAIGLALSKEEVAEELEHAFQGIYSVLVPVFFCVMGMLVNVPAMLDTSVMTFSIVYTLLAIVGKIVGCGLPTYLVGFNHRGAMRVGIGMLPRGEVALIVAGVGLAGGVIGSQMFGVAIAMTLVTTLIAPPILVKIFDERPGLKSLEAKEAEKPAKEKTRVFTRERKYKYTLHGVEEHMAHSCVKNITHIFHENGYEVKLVSHDPLIHVASKDDLNIEIREEPPAIHFDMPEDVKKEIHDIVEKGMRLYQGKVKQITLRKGN